MRFIFRQERLKNKGGGISSCMCYNTRVIKYSQQANTIAYLQRDNLQKADL